MPVRLAEIALVARHLAGIRHALGTDLKTGIDEAFATCEFDLEPDDEVGEVSCAGEKLILLHRLSKRASGDAAILNAPCFRVALPSRQSDAVKQRSSLPHLWWSGSRPSQRDQTEDEKGEKETLELRCKFHAFTGFE